MPILRKECEIFPDDLFALPVDEAPWEVAHLRSRQEKLVARMLLEERQPFYLPQVEQRTRRNGRVFVAHLPLFPGYIFLRRGERLHRTLWRTRALVCILDVPDQAELARELHVIRELQLHGARLTAHEHVTAGDAVHVVDGVFRGYAGTVVAERGAMRLVVSVSMLRKTVEVEFPRTLLSTVQRSAARDATSR